MERDLISDMVKEKIDFVQATIHAHIPKINDHIQINTNY